RPERPRSTAGARPAGQRPRATIRLRTAPPGALPKEHRDREQSMTSTAQRPFRVAITGAAGQIGYQLAFRIASGQLVGPDRPVILQLLEITPALGALNGVAMELDDCAFDTLHGLVVTDDAKTAFRDADCAL